MPRYIAKPDTWFKAGTEVTLVDFLYEDADGGKVGLFRGLRICENPEAEAGHPVGFERVDDEEICGFDEFDIIEEGDSK